jgi:hypothetical protein
MLKAVPSRADVVPVRVDPGPPWASALNATAEHADIAVTLLAMAVAGDVVRVTGLVEVRGRTSVRIASIPALEVLTADGVAMRLLDAHMQPSGAVSWMSWTYDRPGIVSGRYGARIDHIELEHMLGGATQMDVPGPWSFALAVHPPSVMETAAPSGDDAGRA